MKLRLLVPLLALAGFPLLAENADTFYRQGMLAAQQGDAETARAAFTKVLQIQPNHPYARYQLGRLDQTKDAMTATRRKQAIAGVTIPEIDFDEAPFADAIQALGQMIESETEKADPEKVLSPNFVIQDPSGTLGERTVSLRLKKIPANVALDYLLDQASATARFEEHATVIRPAPAAAGASASVNGG